jgi:tetratricopeptide (TPR) repeat protein
MMRDASRALRSRKMSRVQTMLGLDAAGFAELLMPPLEAGPDTDPEFYYRRGESRKQSRDFEGAVADYSLAVAGDPDRAVWLVKRAELLLWRLKQPDRALADLDRALRLDPARSEAYLLRAYIYQKRDEHERAIVECNRAMLERPDYSQALFVRADSKFALGRFEDAIRDHDLFLADGSFSIEVLIQRSRANWALGRKEAAIADAERARGEGTSTYYGHHVVRALSHYYAYTGRSLPSVFTMTDICLSKTPEDAECMDARAEALLRDGQREAARKLNLRLEARADLPARFRKTTLSRKARLDT